MAISSQGSTFQFNGTTYTVTSVSVRAPTPEVVNMTTFSHGKGQIVMVPTGDITAPGGMDVEGFGFANPASLVGVAGELVFGTPAGSISKRAICDSAVADAKVGDVLRLRMTFTLTDDTGG